MITLEFLKSLVSYDPITGLFIWIKARPKTRCKGIAGYTSPDGYVRIGVNRKYYPAHCLAWFYMTGEWSELIIDHINGIRNDNRWCNLREATVSQNNTNKKVSTRSKTGVKGVSKEGIRYRVILCLGSFDTIEEATKIYNEAAFKLHGEFAHVSIKGKNNV